LIVLKINTVNNKAKCLIGVSYTSHTAHDAEDVVVNGVYTYLGSGGTGNCGGRKDKLKYSVVNSGEVACARRLVLLRAKGE
jgi:Uri superfamily endonuclease